MSRVLAALSATFFLLFSGCDGQSVARADGSSEIIKNDMPKVKNRDLEILASETGNEKDEEVVKVKSAPQAFQGRWTFDDEKVDCDPNGKNQHVMMTVTANQLKMRESIATLSGPGEATETDFFADYDFASEDRRWTHNMWFRLEEDGKKLLVYYLTPGSRKVFRYQRCPA